MFLLAMACQEPCVSNSTVLAITDRLARFSQVDVLSHQGNEPSTLAIMLYSGFLTLI